MQAEHNYCSTCGRALNVWDANKYVCNNCYGENNINQIKEEKMKTLSLSVREADLKNLKIAIDENCFDKFISDYIKEYLNLPKATDIKLHSWEIYNITNLQFVVTFSTDCNCLCEICTCNQ